jgi:hypothetical protein
MEGERRPRHSDQVWAEKEKFLITARCQEAMAERERNLRRIEALSQPCRDEYLRHRRGEIIKQMNKPN